MFVDCDVSWGGLRWVERTFGRIGRWRRLSKDYEGLPTTSEAPVYGTMARRLWARIQPRTSWLTCQPALSQTSSSARLPAARSFAAHQARYWVVSALTGRPSTNRSQVSSCQPPPGWAQRASSP